MVNWGSHYINPGPRTNVKKTLKFRVDIGVQQGKNCIKLEV
jgi:hypothetical protein